jgi:hypothetical protein
MTVAMFDYCVNHVPMPNVALEQVAVLIQLW